MYQRFIRRNFCGLWYKLCRALLMMLYTLACWQLKCFRALSRISSFTVSGVYIYTSYYHDKTVLHNIIASYDQIGTPNFVNEMSLHQECGLSFSDRLWNGRNKGKWAAYETIGWYLETFTNSSNRKIPSTTRSAYQLNHAHAIIIPRCKSPIGVG